MSSPQGQKIGPAGLEPAARARNWRKATVKMHKRIRNRMYVY